MDKVEFDQTVGLIEQKLISELLNDPLVIEDAILKLDPIDFINKEMAIIFGAITTLHRNGKHVDEHTVNEFIYDHNELHFEDYPAVIKTLVNKFTTSVEVDDHIELIKNASIKRQMDQFANDLVATKIDFTDFNEQVYQLQQRFMNIINSKKSTEIKSIEEIAKDFQEKLNQIYNQIGELSGTTSGYTQIDKITNGFQPGDLIILAARPGMGKTALALNFLLNAANTIQQAKRQDPNNKDVVVMFSLEMGADQIFQRLVSCSSMVDVSMTRKGKMESIDLESLTTAIQEVSELPILIDDASDNSVLDIQSKIKQTAINRNIKLVVVDYLGLIKSTSHNYQQNRQQEVSNITRMLKHIAKTNKVPIITVAQLSRKIEERRADNRRPILSDLRESGAIEQDADIVSFIYQEDFENGEESLLSNQNGPANPTVLVEYIIAKHRNGPVGNVRLNFMREFSKFIDRGSTNTENA